MTTKVQELTKKQKRARNDARTAWRAMTPAQRGEFLAWAGDNECDGMSVDRAQWSHHWPNSVAAS